MRKIKGSKMNARKTHLVIILSYALITSIGCRQKSKNHSSLADIPTHKSAYKYGLPETDSEDQKVLQLFLENFRSMGFAEDIPFVILNKKKKTRRAATSDEVYGVKALGEDEEIFFGNVRARYVAGMKAIPQRKATSKRVSFAIEKYDLASFEKLGLIQKRDALKVSFDPRMERGTFEKEMSRKMEALNSFFKDPSLIGSLAEAREQWHSDRHSINHLERSKTFSNPLNFIAAEISMVLVIFVLCFQTQVFAAFKMPISSLIKNGSTLLYSSIVVLLFIVIVASLVSAPGYQKRNYKNIDGWISEKKERMEELRLKYGTAIEGQGVVPL